MLFPLYKPNSSLIANIILIILIYIVVSIIVTNFSRNFCIILIKSLNIMAIKIIKNKMMIIVIIMGSLKIIKRWTLENRDYLLIILIILKLIKEFDLYLLYILIERKFLLLKNRKNTMYKK